jgi:hypothetical protein
LITHPPTLLKTYAVIHVLKERSGKIITVLGDFLSKSSIEENQFIAT